LMKQFLLLALVAVSVARLASAASCSGGTLAGYVALGATGCTIGGDTLYNFKVLGGSGGATQLAASLVSLTPSGGTYNPSLATSVNVTVSAPNTDETMFTYDISGPGFISASALLSGSSETGDGGVSGIENYCAGGFFGADGVDGCPGITDSLVTVDGAQNSAGDLFSKVSFLAVTNDLALGGITDGTASGGKLTDSFTAVPEPATLAIAGFGLLFAAAYRKRSKYFNPSI
jgi:hypothetical protein